MKSHLKEIVEDRGLKVTWISERSGVSRNTIHTYLKDGIPALDKAYAIARALDLSVYEIWKDEETSEN